MSMYRHSRTPDEPVVRPSDPAVRKANLHRILRLLKPYKLRLSEACGLIFISAGLGVIPPFLLRDVLDNAIQVDPQTGQASVELGV